MTNNNKQYFTTLEVLKVVHEELKFTEIDEFVNNESLLDVVFMQSNYIDTLEESKKALKQIQGTSIVQFAKNNSTTEERENIDFNNSLMLANYLMILKARKVISDLQINGLPPYYAERIVNAVIKNIEKGEDENEQI